MPKKISDIRAKTQFAVPPEFLKDRAGPGSKRLHYVEGDYVVYQLNEIFGVECVDITVPRIALESERTFAKPGDVKSVHKGQGVYVGEQGPDIEAMEFSYSATVRIAVTVLDDDGKERVFVREGVGTGTGTCNLGPGATTHQARQIAIKYAATDGTKRAAKTAGSIFGLSIGADGKQKYSLDEEALADDTEPGPVTPAASNVLSNESAKPTAPTGQRVSPPATVAASRPNSTAPAAVAKPAPAAAAAAASQPQPQPKPAAAPATSQPPAETKPAPQAAQATATPQPAANAANQTAAVSTAAISLTPLPIIDEDAMRGMTSQEWTQSFQNLKKAMNERTTLEDVAEVARIAGCFYRLVNQSQLLEDRFKTQVKPLMTSHLQKHVTAHALQIDLAAEIAKGETTDEPAEEEAFQAPF